MKQPLSSFWKGGKRKYKEADMRKRPELKDVIDQFFVVQQEMIPGKGEDSYLLEVKEKEAVPGQGPMNILKITQVLTSPPEPWPMRRTAGLKNSTRILRSGKRIRLKS